ncbi:MAG: hypothetical protein JOY59_12310 [Candidatus Eremiobacteraeota bacterium]|nr:hypothetical protein [Candidatus Eremiobacteraeota bacterium]
MKALIAFAGLLFACALPCVAAGENASLPVLRHLVFDIRSSSTLRQDRRRSGLSYLDPGTQQMVNPTGGNYDTISVSSRNLGQLIVDVIAATQDGGLVVDATLDGDTTKMGKTRIAIFPDGRLSYNPSLDLPPEVLRVLPLLGRRVVTGHDVGDTWTVPLPGKNVKGENDFRITGEAPGDNLNVELQTSMQVSGYPHVDESSRTTSVYSPRLTVPMKVSFTGLIHKEDSGASQSLQTINLTVDATLVQDSFAKK